MLGTERDTCGDHLQGTIDGSILDFTLPCAHDPSEMHHNVIKATSQKVVPKKPQILTIYINPFITSFCGVCLANL